MKEVEQHQGNGPGKEGAAHAVDSQDALPPSSVDLSAPGHSDLLQPNPAEGPSVSGAGNQSASETVIVINSSQSQDSPVPSSGEVSVPSPVHKRKKKVQRLKKGENKNSKSSQETAVKEKIDEDVLGRNIWEQLGVYKCAKCGFTATTENVYKYHVCKSRKSTPSVLSASSFMLTSQAPSTLLPTSISSTKLNTVKASSSSIPEVATSLQSEVGSHERRLGTAASCTGQPANGQVSLSSKQGTVRYLPDKNAYKCMQCCFEGHDTAFIEHLMYQVFATPYHCQYCKKSFAERRLLHRHFDSEHPTEKRKCKLRKVSAILSIMEVAKSKKVASFILHQAFQSCVKKQSQQGKTNFVPSSAQNVVALPTFVPVSGTVTCAVTVTSSTSGIAAAVSGTSPLLSSDCVLSTSLDSRSGGRVDTSTALQASSSLTPSSEQASSLQAAPTVSGLSSLVPSCGNAEVTGVLDKNDDTSLIGDESPTNGSDFNGASNAGAGDIVTDSQLPIIISCQGNYADHEEGSGDDNQSVAALGVPERLAAAARLEEQSNPVEVSSAVIVSLTSETCSSGTVSGVITSNTTATNVTSCSSLDHAPLLHRPQIHNQQVTAQMKTNTVAQPAEQTIPFQLYQSTSSHSRLMNVQPVNTAVDLQAVLSNIVSQATLQASCYSLPSLPQTTTQPRLYAPLIAKPPLSFNCTTRYQLLPVNYILANNVNPAAMRQAPPKQPQTVPDALPLQQVRRKSGFSPVDVATTVRPNPQRTAPVQGTSMQEIRPKVRSMGASQWQVPISAAGSAEISLGKLPSVISTSETKATFPNYSPISPASGSPGPIYTPISPASPVYTPISPASPQRNFSPISPPSPQNCVQPSTHASASPLSQHLDLTIATHPLVSAQLQSPCLVTRRLNFVSTCSTVSETAVTVSGTTATARALIDSTTSSSCSAVPATNETLHPHTGSEFSRSGSAVSGTNETASLHIYTATSCSGLVSGISETTRPHIDNVTSSSGSALSGTSEASPCVDSAPAPSLQVSVADTPVGRLKMKQEKDDTNVQHAGVTMSICPITSSTGVLSGQLSVPLENYFIKYKDSFACLRCSKRFHDYNAFYIHVWNHQHVDSKPCTRCCDSENQTSSQIKCTETTQIVEAVSAITNARLLDHLRDDCREKLTRRLLQGDTNDACTIQEDDKLDSIHSSKGALAESVEAPVEETAVSTVCISPHQAQGERDLEKNDEALTMAVNGTALTISSESTIPQKQVEYSTEGNGNPGPCVVSSAQENRSRLSDSQSPTVSGDSAQEDSQNPSGDVDSRPAFRTGTDHDAVKSTGENEIVTESEQVSSPGTAELPGTRSKAHSAQADGEAGENDVSVNDDGNRINNPSEEIQQAEENSGVQVSSSVPHSWDRSVESRQVSQGLRQTADSNPARHGTQTVPEEKLYDRSDVFFICALCDFCCILAVDFTMHLNSTHHNEEVFPCYHCNYQGKYTTDLTNHITAHTEGNSRMYLCPCAKSVDCSYRTDSLKILGIHIQNHTGNNFWCHNCHTPFEDGKELLLHLKQNSMTLYSCSRCPSRFLNKQAFQHHGKTEHSKGSAFVKVLKVLLCKERKENNYKLPVNVLPIHRLSVEEELSSHLREQNPGSKPPWQAPSLSTCPAVDEVSCPETTDGSLLPLQGSVVGTVRYPEAIHTAVGTVTFPETISTAVDTVMCPETSCSAFATVTCPKTSLSAINKVTCPETSHSAVETVSIVTCSETSHSAFDTVSSSETSHSVNEAITCPATSHSIVDTVSCPKTSCSAVDTCPKNNKCMLSEKTDAGVTSEGFCARKLPPSEGDVESAMLDARATSTGDQHSEFGLTLEQELVSDLTVDQSECPAGASCNNKASDQIKQNIYIIEKDKLETFRHRVSKIVHKPQVALVGDEESPSEPVDVSDSSDDSPSCFITSVDKVNTNTVSLSETPSDVAQSAAVQGLQNIDEVLVETGAKDPSADAKVVVFTANEDESTALHDTILESGDETTAKASSVQCPEKPEEDCIHLRDLFGIYELHKLLFNKVYYMHNTRFCCPICDIKFHSEKLVQEHIFGHFVRLVMCNLCQFRCTLKEDLVRHFGMNHRGEKKIRLNLQVNKTMLLNELRASEPLTIQKFEDVCLKIDPREGDNNHSSSSITSVQPHVKSKLLTMNDSQVFNLEERDAEKSDSASVNMGLLIASGNIVSNKRPAAHFSGNSVSSSAPGKSSESKEPGNCGIKSSTSSMIHRRRSSEHGRKPSESVDQKKTKSKEALARPKHGTYRVVKVGAISIFECLSCKNRMLSPASMKFHLDTCTRYINSQHDHEHTAKAASLAEKMRLTVDNTGEQHPPQASTKTNESKGGRLPDPEARTQEEHSYVKKKLNGRNGPLKPKVCPKTGYKLGISRSKSLPEPQQSSSSSSSSQHRELGTTRSNNHIRKETRKRLLKRLSVIYSSSSEDDLETVQPDSADKQPNTPEAVSEPKKVFQEVKRMETKRSARILDSSTDESDTLAVDDSSDQQPSTCAENFAESQNNVQETRSLSSPSKGMVCHDGRHDEADSRNEDMDSDDAVVLHTEKEQIYKCKYCNFSAPETHTKDLRGHMQQKHPAVLKLAKCAHCDYVYDSAKNASRLQKHTEKDHPGKKQKLEPLPLSFFYIAKEKENFSSIHKMESVVSTIQRSESTSEANDIEVTGNEDFTVSRIRKNVAKHKESNIEPAGAGSATQEVTKNIAKQIVLSAGTNRIIGVSSSNPVNEESLSQVTVLTSRKRARSTEPEEESTKHLCSTSQPGMYETKRHKTLLETSSGSAAKQNKKSNEITKHRKHLPLKDKFQQEDGKRNTSDDSDHEMSADETLCNIRNSSRHERKRERSSRESKRSAAKAESLSMQTWMKRDSDRNNSSDDDDFDIEENEKQVASKKSKRFAFLETEEYKKSTEKPVFKGLAGAPVSQEMQGSADRLTVTHHTAPDSDSKASAADSKASGFDKSSADKQPTGQSIATSLPASSTVDSSKQANPRLGVDVVRFVCVICNQHHTDRRKIKAHLTRHLDCHAISGNCSDGFTSVEDAKAHHCDGYKDKDVMKVMLEKLVRESREKAERNAEAAHAVPLDQAGASINISSKKLDKSKTADPFRQHGEWKQSIQCRLCQDLLDSVSELKNHFSTNHADSSKEKEWVDVETQNVYNLKGKLIKEGTTRAVVICKYVCDLCSFRCSTRDVIIQHKTEAHPGKDQWSLLLQTSPSVHSSTVHKWHKKTASPSSILSAVVTDSPASSTSVSNQSAAAEKDWEIHQPIANDTKLRVVPRVRLKDVILCPAEMRKLLQDNGITRARLDNKDLISKFRRILKSAKCSL